LWFDEELGSKTTELYSIILLHPVVV